MVPNTQIDEPNRKPNPDRSIPYQDSLGLQPRNPNWITAHATMTIPDSAPYRWAPETCRDNWDTEADCPNSLRVPEPDSSSRDSEFQSLTCAVLYPHLSMADPIFAMVGFVIIMKVYPPPIRVARGLIAILFVAQPHFPATFNNCIRL